MGGYVDAMELHPKRQLFGFPRLRFAVGPTGIDVHTGSLKRELAWSEIQNLSLERVGDGYAVFATLSTPGAQQLKLVDLAIVRETPDEVAEALASAAGGRFVDLRGRPTPNAVAAGSAFTVVLRGFEVEQIDWLVFQCESAMAEQDPDRARLVVQRYRTSPPEVALRGYDRMQVDMYIARVEGRLAGEPATG